MLYWNRFGKIGEQREENSHEQISPRGAGTLDGINSLYDDSDGLPFEQEILYKTCQQDRQIGDLAFNTVHIR